MKSIIFSTYMGLEEAVIQHRKKENRKLVVQPKGAYGMKILKNPQRVVAYNSKGNMKKYNGKEWLIKPFYEVGDIVGVKQSYKTIIENDKDNEDEWLYRISYVHNCKPHEVINLSGWDLKMYVEARLMPYHIKINDVSCQYIQDITDEECLLEGLNVIDTPEGKFYGFYDKNSFRVNGSYDIRKAYGMMIDELNKCDIWSTNPLTWVYKFECFKNNF